MAVPSLPPPLLLTMLYRLMQTAVVAAAESPESAAELPL
jgi:hypothetical protein